MKVKKLIKLLSNINPELEVIMSSDEEGNTFSPLEELDNNLVYDSKTRTVGYDKLTPDLIKSGFKKEFLIKGDKVLILYPKY